MAEKRGLQNEELWPDDAVLERARESFDELLRRWQVSIRSEARDFGLDPDEVWTECRKVALESVMAWQRSGGKKPLGFMKSLLRLRLLSMKERQSLRPQPLSLDAENPDGISLGDSLKDTSDPSRYMEGDADSRWAAYTRAKWDLKELDETHFLPMVQGKLEIEEGDAA